ncbi:MAG: UvrD-helicase domain-containing protein [Saprospiraceae bacterium]|jgi:superfamily I DNA/RNA helicase|nr:UvrD-helicase domain-containing protein [Saprospiraceae bacterium]MBX7179264.1 UvrD-helicase domain-containing protein [Saprospiraceae bacterium]MCB0592222.1 UvrD-helicase domain-containing protein [Saprospiraceae bacterium]MCO5281887.1 UvrD-helicase domain-containing protein [Saprospiraceae bacterium]MCO6470439.1 UvrD-helicase domain-containing protein [Saprospiraceae bacterium]
MLETNIKIDLSALNDQQKHAVISEDKRLLVLAGAGSGKTKTLLQKLIYLIEEKGASPSSILAITFTKNATNEMLDRLIMAADESGAYEKQLFDKRKSIAEKDRERYYQQKKYKWIDGLTVKTFHGFCYNILRNYGVNEFDNKFKIIGDAKRDDEDELAKHVAPETVFEVFHKLLIEACEDTEYLLNLKRYILDYIIDKIHLKQIDPNYLPKDGKYYTTLDNTKVRSKSEQFIADWLYRHSIKYEYEPLLNVKDFSFTPDFYIPEANLYIEHISDKSFSMKNKEEQIQKGNLLLVKTFEAMTKDSALFNHTLDKIVKNRLPSDYHKTVSINFKEEFNGYHEDVKDFVRQIMRITDMIKVENIDMDSVLDNARNDQHERVRNFYELAIPVVRKYLHYCTDKSYLDFNDLISRSTSLFQNHSDIANKYKSKYQYILVDEFQDVNNLQVELIKLLLTDDTQLFCVGDDWQSIYGFRGSNVSYIVEFENHFTDAKTIKLNLNYRSTQNIVGASNEVIRHNKFKVEKDVQASKMSEHKIVVFAGNTEEENIQFCVDKVREILNDGISNDEILFLYRRSKMFTPYFYRFKNENIRVQGKTIHASKGLEAKVVFIIGLTEGNGGFPDIWLEDRIFQVIKKANHDLLMEEERRLFYVAITRAKDKLFLITQKGNESSFLKEIPATFTVRTTNAIKQVVDKVILCDNCYSQLEILHKYCPYCGQPVDEQPTE